MKDKTGNRLPAQTKDTNQHLLEEEKKSVKRKMLEQN
jgi:hypothetical protein